jgi:hypothetical protein
MPAIRIGVHTSQPLAPSRVREVWRALYRTRDATFDSFSVALPILSTRRIPCVGGTGSKKLMHIGSLHAGPKVTAVLSLEESRFIGFIVWADGNQRGFVTSHTQQKQLAPGRKLVRLSSRPSLRIGLPDDGRAESCPYLSCP